jgi:hypothetical protein
MSRKEGIVENNTTGDPWAFRAFIAMLQPARQLELQCSFPFLSSLRLIPSLSF